MHGKCGECTQQGVCVLRPWGLKNRETSRHKGRKMFVSCGGVVEMPQERARPRQACGLRAYVVWMRKGAEAYVWE
jgi:hypothetical protein